MLTGLTGSGKQETGNRKKETGNSTENERADSETMVI